MPWMRVVIVLAAIALWACDGEIISHDLPPDAPDTMELLRRWSGCMTETNFETADMANAWGNLVSSDGKQCQNCHGDGAFGFFASAQSQPFFDAITKHHSWMTMYFTISGTQVIINKDSFKAANSATGHPSFDAANNAGMTALTSFYNATTAMTACGAPRMID